jgi:hypothetical protein
VLRAASSVLPTVVAQLTEQSAASRAPTQLARRNLGSEPPASSTSSFSHPDGTGATCGRPARGALQALDCRSAFFVASVGDRSTLSRRGLRLRGEAVTGRDEK